VRYQSADSGLLTQIKIAAVRLSIPMCVRRRGSRSSPHAKKLLNVSRLRTYSQNCCRWAERCNYLSALNACVGLRVETTPKVSSPVCIGITRLQDLCIVARAKQCCFLKWNRRISFTRRRTPVSSRRHDELP
jgi:hypothetical protein